MLSQITNGISWLVEYKNDIDHRLLETIKNIWDRIGTMQGAKDNSNTIKYTNIIAAAIISGQDIPNAEPALLSRLICLLLKPNPQFSVDEVMEFERLKEMQATGLTGITNSLFEHRKLVSDLFNDTFKEMSLYLKNGAKQSYVIEERQYVNYAILLTVIAIMNKVVKLPFTISKAADFAFKLMIQQNGISKQANEVQKFWDKVAFMMSEKIIIEDKDYMFRGEHIIIRLKIIYQLYCETARKANDKIIDEGTLCSYLFDSDAYSHSNTKTKDGKPISFRFKSLENPTTATAFSIEQIQNLYDIDLRQYAIFRNESINADVETTETTEYA